MQTPILASLLLSVAIGIIGSFMLINRSQFIAAAIAHGSYGGIGIAIYFGFSLLLSTTIFAIALALLLAYITYHDRYRSDTLIGVIWAVGMSLGIIFIDLTPGYHPNMMSFLFGDILMVPMEDIYFMTGIDILLIISLIFMYSRFLAISYDINFALLNGLNVKIIYAFLLTLTALTIVMSIRSVGLILVIALFSIPPFIAEKFTSNFKLMMFFSAILGFIFSLVGLYLSYIFDISATAAIILTAAIAFFGVILFKKGG
jgi:zinc transport system permease protein